MNKTVERNLFLLSLGSLFLELLIIRWISTEIRVFAYFKNMALIACFLGLGIGYATARRYKSMWISLIVLWLLVLSLRMPFVPPEKLPFSHLTTLLSFDDFFFWGWMKSSFELTRVMLGLGLLLLIFGIIVALFIPIGQALGTMFDAVPQRIRAYTINVVGSLLGILLFTLLSFLSLAPHWWLLVGVLLLTPAVLSERRQLLFTLLTAVLLCVIVARPDAPNTVRLQAGDQQATAHSPAQVRWSPYQKLVYRQYQLASQSTADPLTFSVINVNNTFYQFIFDLSPDYVEKHRAMFPQDPVMLRYNYYDIPYRFVANPREILIVGAGTGNDVAGALRNTDAHITAVEIDPGIYQFGRDQHPEKPYDSPRVTAVIDDARAFFKKTTGRYDLIIYGLLDSHTLSSNFSNVSLDNYVYTKESFAEARRLLKPGGLVVMAFGFTRPWIGQRIAQSMHTAFDDWPLSFLCFNPFYQGTGGVVFVAGDLATLVGALQNDEQLRRYVAARKNDFRSDLEPTSDDWPYLWLRARKIPTLHLLVTFSLLLLTVLGGLLAWRDRRRMDGEFFFLGAAFLLFEVHLISKLMLLFGTTWVVNTFVIAGVHVMILAANAWVIKVRIRSLTPYYVALFVSLLAVYAVPLDTLLFGNQLARGVTSGVLLTIPLMFAGIIFATNFARADSAADALGSNLLGAIFGGLLEGLSFVTGIRMLALLAVALYLAAYLFNRRRA
ncbi:MAG TPA: methyltransferase domain-containing protein [bacterium]|nr:methyltransferase domain-containing protein [bacterium]